MIEPMNAAAEPARLETLVRNLKDLRRSLDAGSMTGPPATFGLEHPDAIVRVWGSENEGGHRQTAEPLATLAVGKTVNDCATCAPAEAARSRSPMPSF